MEPAAVVGIADEQLCTATPTISSPDTSAAHSPSAPAPSAHTLPSPSVTATAAAQNSSCSSQAPAPDLGDAAPQVVKVAGKLLVFYGPLVCSICANQGHAANTCSADFCSMCSMFGHDADRYVFCGTGMCGLMPLQTYWMFKLEVA